jgi:hypothetical protein
LLVLHCLTPLVLSDDAGLFASEVLPEAGDKKPSPRNEGSKPLIHNAKAPVSAKSRWVCAAHHVFVNPHMWAGEQYHLASGQQ